MPTRGGPGGGALRSPCPPGTVQGAQPWSRTERKGLLGRLVQVLGWDAGRSESQPWPLSSCVTLHTTELNVPPHPTNLGFLICRMRVAATLSGCRRNDMKPSVQSLTHSRRPRRERIKTPQSTVASGLILISNYEFDPPT